MVEERRAQQKGSKSLGGKLSASACIEETLLEAPGGDRQAIHV